MTCKEFKKKFPNTMLLVFVMDKFSHIYKVNSEFITFFMRTFITEHVPHWNRMYFYKLEDEKRLLTEDGKLTHIKDRAKFTHYIAKAEDQQAFLCSLKWVPSEPDIKILEGKKVKVISLNAK